MERWRQYLTEGQKNRYVTGLHAAYRVTGERHDEGLGDNATTFGILVSNTAKHFIETDLAADADRGDVRVTRPANSFQVATPACTFHYYKFLDNVHSIKFDQSSTKEEIAKRNQLVLPFTDAESAQNDAIVSSDNPPFLHLVLAHTGTPARGLTEVWVGAPNGLGRAGVSPWAWVEQVHLGGSGGDAGLDLPRPEPPDIFSSRKLPDVDIIPRKKAHG